MPTLFEGRVFQLIYNSTHNSLRAYTSLRFATAICKIPPKWRR